VRKAGEEITGWRLHNMGFMHKILKSENGDPEFWYLRGRELCTSGYYLDALEALDKMISISPHHADSWFLRGYALYQMGKYEESLQFFDQALSLNPRLHEALTYKGLIYSGFGRHSEAITQYDRALTINPEYGKAWYVKGLTLAIQERYDEAISAYEQVLIIEPKHFDALTGISIAMKKRERSRELKPVRKPLPQSFESPVGLPVPVTTEFSLSRPETISAPQPEDRAIPENIRQADVITVPRKKPASVLFSPFIDSDTTRAISARGSIGDLLKTEPIAVHQPDMKQQTETETPVSLPRTTHRNTYDELIQQTLEVLDKTREDSGSLNNLGDLYIKVGKYQLATEAYERVLELEPENARTWAALGDARRKIGMYDEAQFAYDQALGIDGDNIQIWISRAKALAMQDRYEEAIDSCDSAIERDCDNIDAWLYKGFILKKIQRHSDALQAYNRVLTINPHHDHAMRQRKTLINSS